MTRILIVGGTGFIGRYIVGRLRDHGHCVVAASRAAIDLARDDETTLRDKVATFEVVINCAGLARDDDSASMARVHGEGTTNLFRACIGAGVKRLVHLSALGVASRGPTNYQRTKGIAEDYLNVLDPSGERIDWCVLRPSLVVGRGGASLELQLALAALPFAPRVGGGQWRLQPVHIDDLTELVAALVTQAAPMPRSIDVVGPKAMTTDELTMILRQWLGLPRVSFIDVPTPLLKAVAWIAGKTTRAPLHPEIIELLSLGNVSDAGPMTAALGRAPRDLATATARTPACAADRIAAHLFFLRPALRWSLGLLWIATGLLSFGLYPIEKSYALLAEIGLHDSSAAAALYGGAAIDLLLGALLLFRWRPVAVGLAQLAMMLVFTAIATRLPAEYWLHPFAPLLKNLPIAAALLVMIVLET